MEQLEFYTDINDIYDIDIEALRTVIKSMELKGKPALIAESPHAVVVLFYESNDGIQFFSYSDITGPSRAFKAKNLDAAISKASCLGMLSDSLGLQKATQAQDGRLPIDKKKYGINFGLERFPSTEPKKRG